MLTVARSGHTLLERLTQVVGRGEPQLAADVGSLGVDIALGLAEATADVAQLLAERPERPFNAQEAAERDQTEIENLEKGGPIAIADYYIYNNKDLKSFVVDFAALMKEIGFVD